MSDQIFWYVTRSSALISWLGAALSMLVGMMTSSRLLGRRPTIPWLVDLHRGFAGLAVIFLLIHLGSLYLDGFIQFGFLDLLVPWVATVPGLSRSSMAYGVIAAWLIAAVQISSYFKDRISGDVWRTIHLTSFASLGFGTLHAIEAGSDVDNPIILALGVSVLAALVLVSLVRLVRLKTGTLRATPDEEDPFSPRQSDTRPIAPRRP